LGCGYGRRPGIITVGPLWRGGDNRDLGNPKFLLIGVFVRCMSEARALCIVMGLSYDLALCYA